MLSSFYRQQRAQNASMYRKCFLFPKHEDVEEDRDGLGETHTDRMGHTNQTNLIKDREGGAAGTETFQSIYVCHCLFPSRRSPCFSQAR